jgi:hypothetical protein
MILYVQIDDPKLEGSARIHEWQDEVKDLEGEVHTLSNRANEISIDSLVRSIFW